jgi:hypothetical protein
MAPSLPDFPTEIVEEIADYLQPGNDEVHLHSYKCVPIFNFRMANKQLAAKSERVFAKTYFSDRVVHGIDTKINQVVQIAKHPMLNSYLKWVSLMFLPVTVPGAIRLNDPLITQALNELPKITQLDILTPYTFKPPECSKFSSDLHMPQLTQLIVRNIAVDSENLAAFMTKHDNLSSVDLGSVRLHSGWNVDILNSACKLPRLLKFIFSRSPGRHNRYDKATLGCWNEDGYEIRLGITMATVVARDQVQMRHAMGVLSKLYLDSIDGNGNYPPASL